MIQLPCDTTLFFKYFSLHSFLYRTHTILFIKYFSFIRKKLIKRPCIQSKTFIKFCKKTKQTEKNLYDQKKYNFIFKIFTRMNTHRFLVPVGVASIS